MSDNPPEKHVVIGVDTAAPDGERCVQFTYGPEPFDVRDSLDIHVRSMTSEEVLQAVREYLAEMRDKSPFTEVDWISPIAPMDETAFEAIIAQADLDVMCRAVGVRRATQFRKAEKATLTLSTFNGSTFNFHPVGEISDVWFEESSTFGDVWSDIDIPCETWIAEPLSASFQIDIAQEDEKKLDILFSTYRTDYGSMMDAVPKVIEQKVLHGDERYWDSGNHRPARSKKAKGQKWGSPKNQKVQKWRK